VEDADFKLIFAGIRNMKMKQFIMAYTNPESSTYDNGSGSYRAVYKTDNINVASVEAHTMLAKPHVQEAMGRYRAYIHETHGFELDWLDNNLRNLYYKVKQNNCTREELSVLKSIGDRIGAFSDTKQNSKGLTVDMTPEQEKMCGRIAQELLAEDQRTKIKKVD